jgi:hypothetical protein
MSSTPHLLQLYAVNATRLQYKLFTICINEIDYLQKILKNTDWSWHDQIAIHDIDTMHYAMRYSKTNTVFKKIE